MSPRWPRDTTMGGEAEGRAVSVPHATNGEVHAPRWTDWRAIWRTEVAGRERDVAARGCLHPGCRWAQFTYPGLVDAAVVTVDLTADMRKAGIA